MAGGDFEASDYADWKEGDGAVAGNVHTGVRVPLSDQYKLALTLSALTYHMISRFMQCGLSNSTCSQNKGTKTRAQAHI